MERITMKDLPKEQRPYEKCMAYGPKALTDSELLAVIIRTGSSERTSLELADAILSQNAPGDGLTGLLHCSLEQLQSIRGVGPVKGIQLLCIGELSRRIWKQKVSAEPVAFTQPGSDCGLLHGRYASFGTGGNPCHVSEYQTASDP